MDKNWTVNKYVHNPVDKNIRLYIEDNQHSCIFAFRKTTMKISELKKKLKANGCYFVCDGKNHEWWWSPVTEQRFQFPRHSTANVGRELMKYVREQSGINVK